ncbi:hypothetical protein [Methanothrix harundinacea]|uniref:Uncharacterized protein n=1 Tax=Methanothrix harundinacea (strain 6Ac) TaxID=1110509 RepID=G7WK03_METH6|nr:hypothetical protein [Methanothrix harundinacea]AET63444.1 hypothetical protein Mhar_0051 [Methanothrix harundinacea 6Ac]
MLSKKGKTVAAVMLFIIYSLSMMGSLGYFSLDYGYVNITVITPQPTVWYTNTTIYPSGKVVDGFLINMSASGAIGNEVVFWADATPSQGGQFTPPDPNGLLNQINTSTSSVEKYLRTNLGYWYAFILLPDGSVTLKAEDNATLQAMFPLLTFDWRNETLAEAYNTTKFVVSPTYENDFPFQVDFPGGIKAVLDIDSYKSVWFDRTDDFPSGKSTYKAAVDMNASGSIGREVAFFVDENPEQGPIAIPWTDEDMALYNNSAINTTLIPELDGEMHTFNASGYYYAFVLFEHGAVAVTAEDNQTLERMMDLLYFEQRDDPPFHILLYNV